MFEELSHAGRLLILDATDLNQAVTPGRAVSTAHVALPQRPRSSRAGFAKRCLSTATIPPTPCAN
jgi:hypothetical protein